MHHFRVTPHSARGAWEPVRAASPCRLLVKGIGEIGITGVVAAAIANAVYNATGVRVRELPITLDKVMEGMRGLA